MVRLEALTGRRAVVSAYTAGTLLKASDGRRIVTSGGQNLAVNENGVNKVTCRLTDITTRRFD